MDAMRDLWSKRVKNVRKRGVEIVPKKYKEGSEEMKPLIDEEKMAGFMGWRYLGS